MYYLKRSDNAVYCRDFQFTYSIAARYYDYHDVERARAWVLMTHYVDNHIFGSNDYTIIGDDEFSVISIMTS